MSDRLDEIRKLLCDAAPFVDGVENPVAGAERDLSLSRLPDLPTHRPVWECGWDSAAIHYGRELRRCATEIERLRAEVRGDALPRPHLDVNGCVFRAEGVVDGVPWSIRAEAETNNVARCKVRVSGRAVADVSVHADGRAQLPEECQTICAALVWSAFRALRSKQADIDAVLEEGET